MNEVQDVFLKTLRANATPVTIFLVNGVKLTGKITDYDSYSMVLRRDGISQLVYKRAVSTIMPTAPITPPERHAKTLVVEGIGEN